MSGFTKETGKQVDLDSQQNKSTSLSDFQNYKRDAFRINRFRRRTALNSKPVPWSDLTYYFEKTDRTIFPDPLNLSGYYQVVHSSKMLLDSILHVCYPHAKPILALLPKAVDGNLTAVLRNHIDEIGAVVVNYPDESQAKIITDFCSAWGEQSVCVTSQNVTAFECDINLFDLIVLDETENPKNEMYINALWHALKPGGLFIYIEQTNSFDELPFIHSKAEKENAVFEDISEIAKAHSSVDLFENCLNVVDEKGRRTQFSVVRKMEATSTDKIPALSLPEIVPIDGDATVSKLSYFFKDHHPHFGIFREDQIVSMTELVSHIATGAAHWNIIQPGVTVLSGDDPSAPTPSFDLALHPFFDDSQCETVAVSDSELQRLISEQSLPVQHDGNFVLTWHDQNIGLLVVRDGKMHNTIPKRWKDAVDEMKFEVGFLEK